MILFRFMAKRKKWIKQRFGKGDNSGENNLLTAGHCFKAQLATTFLVPFAAPDLPIQYENKLLVLSAARQVSQSFSITTAASSGGWRM